MKAVGRTTQRSVCAALGSDGPGGRSLRETVVVGIDIPDGIRIPLRMSSQVDASALGAQLARDDGDERGPEATAVRLRDGPVARARARAQDRDGAGHQNDLG